MTTVPILSHVINFHLKYAPICDLVLPFFTLTSDYCQVHLYMTLVYFCPSNDSDKKSGLGLLPTDVVNNFSCTAISQEQEQIQPEFDLMELVLQDQTKVLNSFPCARYGDEIVSIATARLAHTVVERLLKAFPVCDVIRLVKSAQYLALTVLDRLCEQEAENRYKNAQARKIQRLWRYVIASPFHKIGRQRLIREFTGLGYIDVSM
jgi:hypothetical protein